MLYTCLDLGGVYMIPVRVSFWYEFIPVLTYRSVFVYMIPVKNLIPVQLIPVVVPDRNSHNGMKSYTGIM